MENSLYQGTLSKENIQGEIAVPKTRKHREYISKGNKQVVLWDSY